MAKNPVEEALQRANAKQQARNQEAIDKARQSIDGKTMKNVSEVTAPKPKLGSPDPSGAARTRLNPETKEKIEQIQKGEGNNTEKTAPQEQPESNWERTIKNLLDSKCSPAAKIVEHEDHSLSLDGAPPPQWDAPDNGAAAAAASRDLRQNDSQPTHSEPEMER